MKHAFKDDVDGYYEVELADGEAIPDWAQKLTPCEVQPVAAAPLDLKSALAKLQAKRGPVLTVLGTMMADAQVDGLPADVLALRAARRGLQDLPAYPPFLAAMRAPDATDASVEAAVLARFEELRLALPDHLRKGFRELAG